MLCISASLIALKKRAIAFSIFIVFFVALTHIQGFYILKDLEFADDTTFLLTHITKQGFYWSCIYLFVVSMFLFLLAVSSKYIRTIHTESLYIFCPSKLFYVFTLGVQLICSYVMIFVLVGIDAFTEQSRPGLISGSSILLIFSSVGIIPIIIRLLLNQKPEKIDYICFIITIITTLFFSRIHVIVYAIAVSISYYYGGAVHKITSTIKYTLKASVIFGFSLLLFVAIGALRDALNYTSFDNIFSFLIENPADASLLSIERNYRVSIEGMSGLASAMSSYFDEHFEVPFGAGLDWIFAGTLQAIPGPLKIYTSNVNEFLALLNWHHLTIVAPGLETSFVSFFVFGPFIFCSLFYFISWQCSKFIINQRQHPFNRLLMVIFVANGVFFVRGAWVHWLGFLVAYFIVLMMLRPLVKSFCKRI
jgi:hypothetical protein